MDKVNVALIGYGRWGRNWARVLEEMPDVEVTVYDDAETNLLEAQRHGHVVSSSSPFAGSKAYQQAVVISTPPETHFELAAAALRAGKHVLVEKPMALCERDVHSLWAKADCEKRILMVGHTFLYNPAVQEMKRRTLTDEFGCLYYLHSTRTNMGPIRDDISVHWDLGVHDIAIFNYLTGQLPVSVSAVGAKPLSLSCNLYDAVWATLTYPGSVIAHLYVSWLEPQKVRQVVAVGSNQRIVFDDMDLQEPLRIYNRGVRRMLPETDGFGDFHFAFRDGDIVSPKVDMVEPLKAEALHFLHCVRTGSKPFTDGEHGLQTIRVLEAMDKSLAKGGEAVLL